MRKCHDFIDVRRMLSRRSRRPSVCHLRRRLLATHQRHGRRRGSLGRRRYQDGDGARTAPLLHVPPLGAHWHRSNGTPLQGAEPPAASGREVRHADRQGLPGPAKLSARPGGERLLPRGGLGHRDVRYVREVDAHTLADRFPATDGTETMTLIDHFRSQPRLIAVGVAAVLVCAEVVLRIHERRKRKRQ